MMSRSRTSGMVAVVVVLLAGAVWPATAHSESRVPATLLVHGEDDFQEVDDEISSPDPDLRGRRAVLSHHSLIEVAVDQTGVERLWTRHGLPDRAPGLPAHHVVAVVRIDWGHSSPCYLRRFGHVVASEGAVDVVLPADETDKCGGLTAPFGFIGHDVYAVLLDVTDVTVGTERVRVLTPESAGGPLRVEAETVVPLPVSPTLPRSGFPGRWWNVAVLLLGVGMMVLVASRRRTA